MKSIIYINTDTDIYSGLFKSQVGILQQFCPSQIEFECINIRNPFGKSKSAAIVEMTGWPMRYSNKILWLMPLIASAIILAFRLKKKYPESIFVGRGYYGGLIGWFLSTLDEKFIWDPRSIYPLEELGSGKFNKRNLAFLIWLWLEKKILAASIGAIVVSKGHGKYYKRFAQCGLKSKTPLAVVPCYAIPCNQTRKGLVPKQAYRILKGRSPCAVYSGSLDHKWNKLSIYLPCFRDILLGGNNLIVMTHSSVSDQVLEYLSKACSIPLNELNSRMFIGNVTDQVAQSEILLHSDYGVMLMERTPDWYSRLSVKFAQYRCAGLPVLVSRHFGGAVSLLKKSVKSSYKLYDSKESIEFISLTPFRRKKIQEQSYAIFSPANFHLAVKSFFYRQS